MAVYQFPTPKERLFAALSPEEREFAERLLQGAPNYLYELSGLPKLHPTPAPGAPSAAAAARATTAWFKSVLKRRG